VNGAEIPIWIADYVLASYGTGAIMAVPGHDERDHAFARRFELPIVEVVSGGDVAQAAHAADGVAVNSGFLDGLPTAEAKKRMNAWLEEKGLGSRSIGYKLRDWVFSRQHYWGEPFPIFHCEDGTVELVPDAELPVRLPELDDFKPHGGFESPLERCPEWIQTRHPRTGAPVRRDPSTMPQWAGSCWYYLRFCDPHNTSEPWSREAERYWMPVDLYVGGAEHAVLHLLYARFWHKVFYDLGLVSTREPFAKLLNPGMIQGKSYRCFVDEEQPGPPVGFRDVRWQSETPLHAQSGRTLKEVWIPPRNVRWIDERPLAPESDVELEEVIEKMSKSRGNVISPDEVIAEYGADAMRLYELFMGPLEKGAPWATDGIPGCFRFLQRAWRLFVDEDAPGEPTRALPAGPGTPEQARLAARTIAGVTADMEAVQPNTAISKLMVFARDVAKDAPLPREAGEAFLKLLSPFAPHLAEELWARLGHTTSVALARWPEADPALLVDETLALVVQVNGKRRGEVRVPKDADEAAVRAAVLADETVRRHLQGKEPRRVIVVPGRLVNVVV
jgi:leucyl-tRNA synthetase